MPIELTTLADGGQPATKVAAEIARFLNDARVSLDLALYDVRLPGQVGDRVGDVDVAGLGPARQRDLAVAGVDGDDDPLAVGLEHALEELGIAQGGGADHDPLGAGLEHGRDRGRVAQPAADLDRAADRGRDALHGVEVARLASLRPVEVDHVQELGAFAGPAGCGVDRVRVIDGLLGIVAPQQPDGLAAADIDRRIEDHAAVGVLTQIPAKLASSRSPAVLDFSGWNWTPKTLSRSTAQAKREPYAALPSRSLPSGRGAKEWTK